MKVLIGEEEVKGVAFNIYSEDIKDATADKESVLSGKAFYNNDGRQEGTMSNRGAISAVLDAGTSIDIPKGYHNGEGSVRARGLAEQTVADATAEDILSGKTAWVNGLLMTGTHRRVVSGTITVYSGSFANNQHVRTPALDFKPTGAIFLCIADSQYNDPSEDSYYSQGCAIAAVACGEYEFVLTADDEGRIQSSDNYSSYKGEGFWVEYGDNYIEVTSSYYKFPQGALMLYVAYGD